jgi:hypothetical protein
MRSAPPINLTALNFLPTQQTSTIVNECRPTRLQPLSTTQNIFTPERMTFHNSSASSRIKYIGSPPLRIPTNLPRSETLQPVHYPYIQTLELTTILVLSPEKPSRALKSFAEENSIKLVRFFEMWLTVRYILDYRDGNLITLGRRWQRD